MALHAMQMASPNVPRQSQNFPDTIIATRAIPLKSLLQQLELDKGTYCGEKPRPELYREALGQESYEDHLKTSAAVRAHQSKQGRKEALLKLFGLKLLS